MVDRTPVSSSNVRSIGHDATTNTLAIEFKDGSVYHYADCGKEHFDNLLAAKSIGSYIHKNIKGAYSHSKQ